MIVDRFGAFDKLPSFRQLMSKVNTLVDECSVTRLKTFELRCFVDQIFRQWTKLELHDAVPRSPSHWSRAASLCSSALPPLVSLFHDHSSIFPIHLDDRWPILCSLLFPLVDRHTRRTRLVPSRRTKVCILSTLFSAIITVLTLAFVGLASGSCFISVACNFKWSRSSLAMASASDRSNLVSLLRDFSKSYSTSDSRVLISMSCSSWSASWLLKSEHWKREKKSQRATTNANLLVTYSKRYLMDTAL